METNGTSDTRSPGRARIPLALAGVAALVLFVGLLLVDAYTARVQQRDLALRTQAGQAREIAGRLRYFLSERRYDLHTLAESREVSSYFENLALGMTLPYGLQLSVQDLEDSFARLRAEKRIDGRLIYARIALLDASGAEVAASGHHPGRFSGPPEQVKAACASCDTPTVVVETGTGGKEEAWIVAPCTRRGKQCGTVVAALAAGSLRQLLAEAGSTGRGLVALVRDSTILACTDARPDAMTRLRLATHSLPAPDRVERLRSSGSAVGPLLAVRSQVESAPLAVVRVVRLDEVVLGAPPWQVLLGMGAVFVGMVTWGGLLIRSRTRTLVLATRIEEQARRQEAVERKNDEMRREIAARTSAEEELLGAKEAAESANRAKSEFLANISHEIRTPLNAVIGLTELVLSSDLAPEDREHLSLVLSSGEALLRLINDFLDFSKIEAGRLELDCDFFDPRRLLEETLLPFRASVRTRPLRIRGEAAAGVPESVCGDQARLRQVLVNLVGNAVKFTSEGEVVVRLDVVTEDADAVILSCSVDDTGIGIPADKLQMIFRPFEQADNSTTRRYGGTGLGLAIAGRLVELMGGTLQVESEPGRGSTFRFSVRLARRVNLRAA